MPARPYYMSGAYVRAIQDALTGFLNLFVRLAMPLSILFGLAMVAVTVGYMRNKDSAGESLPLLKKSLSKILGFVLVGLTFLVCWSALKQTQPVAVEALRWKDASEAVANPTSDAPPVYQSGPVAATISEQTFTKNINLPPDIGKRLETEGVQALAPYLPESSASNVLDQTDKLEKRGNLYVLTRQVKRMQESPVAFQNSEVKADFKRIGGRAFELEFKGVYSFKNPNAETANVRFSFPLPQSGTISGLAIRVGSDEVRQPAQSGNYEWSGTVGPGESRSATVTYQVVGSRVWSYDVGSQRRPVDQFSLTVNPDGPTKYLRGSLQPSKNGSSPNWSLSNVVTNQQVALSFPTDAVARETFVQTLSMLPASLALFLFGTWLVAWKSKELKEPVLSAVALALFTFGLGGSTILTSYLGPLFGVIASLAGGCIAVALILGPRSLLAAIPAAMFAAAFLSPEHTGLIVAIVFLGALCAHFLVGREGKPQLSS